MLCCSQNYEQWKSEPVVTTVASIGLPIDKVPFPSVIVCPQGQDYESLNAAIYKFIFEYLKKNDGIDIAISPFEVQRNFANHPSKVRK
jgi:hypothetical protein